MAMLGSFTPFRAVGTLTRYTCSDLAAVSSGGGIEQMEWSRGKGSLPVLVTQ